MRSCDRRVSESLGHGPADAAGECHGGAPTSGLRLDIGLDGFPDHERTT